MLVGSGLVSARETLQLAPYASGFPRRAADRHWHYRVDANERPVCHLVVGRSLAEIQSHAAEFHRACPPLICPPILLTKDEDGLEFLCLEHFSGMTLDELVQAGRCSPRQWMGAVHQAQAMLESTSKNTTGARLQAEVEALVDKVCAMDAISRTDAVILRELVQPAIIAAARNEPLNLRWSNRDFVGRNLLLNDEGDIKLVDYEEASLTHFGHADRLRLMHFSVLPAGLEESSQPMSPWHEIPLWLQHLVQLQKVRPSEELGRHIGETVSRLFSALDRAPRGVASAGRGSFFLHHLTTHQSQSDRLLVERTTWGKSLEAELSSERTRLMQLAKELAERTQWAVALEAELQQGRLVLDEQAALLKARTAWAQSLEQQLESTQGAFAALSRDFDERTRWAQSLEAELTNARAGLAQAAAIEERSARTESLVAELREELVAKAAEASQAASAALDNQMRAEVAESEVRRLAQTVAVAHVHVEHLLGVVRKLQQQVNAAAEEKIEVTSILLMRGQRLDSLEAKLQYMQRKLADYESQLICRAVVWTSTVLSRVVSPT